MASQPSETQPATRRTRKSISGFSPSKATTTDKENTSMDDDFSAPGGLASTAAASRKKLRSKSMGPGGLDALKSTSGNRRVSLAVPSRPPPRSILKPTMPILPDIPPLKPKAKGKGGKGSPSRNSGGDDNSTTRVALRTEEEQQAAAREREERERAAREKEVKDHREARRKSLANRRVSFAAEATLHTFHEIDYPQDSTTSTDRRASSIAAPSPAPPAPPQTQFDHDLDRELQGPSDPPSTPPEQIEDAEVIAESPPDNQREMHQAKHRRSSTGAPGMGFQDDNTITSTVYDSDGGDEVEEDDDEDGDEMEDDDVASNSDSEAGDSDEGDGATMVTVDADEMTSASVMSILSSISMQESMSPIESTTDVDEALRLATEHAGAQATESRRQRPLDEDEEVIQGFIGWGKKAANNNAAPSAPAPAQPAAPSPRSERDEDTAMSMDMDVDMDMDMEMTRPMGGIIKPGQGRQEDEMSMDVTRAYGGIILPEPTTDMESVASSPMIMLDDTVAGEEPMELTMRIGAIRRSSQDNDAESVDNDDLEDMSMELTTVLGGVLGRQSFGANKARRLSRRQTIRGPNDEEDDTPMDITLGVGKIFAGSNSSAVQNNQKENVNNDDEDDEGEADMDMTMGMEITTALGGILKPASPTRTRASLAPAALLPAPLNNNNNKENSENTQTPTRTRRKSSSPPKSVIRSATKSPGLSAFTGKGIHRTPARGSENEPAPTTRAASKSPQKEKEAEPITKPSKASAEPTTPQRTSPVRFIGSRSKSPKRKAASAEKSTTPNSPPKASTSQFSKSLFLQNPSTGTSGPSVVLTPQGRRRQTAFAGAGPASPKITEIFSRRSSLVDAATEFVVGSPALKDRPAVSFEELSRQGTPPEDEATNSGPLDDKEATQNLKDLIQNLSPKKNPFKGRKSLHVGSAKGLLGKRPLELDDEDLDDGEIESQNFVKRLKGEPSPVKNVRLQQPPSMMETIGRSSRSRRSPSATPLPFDSNQQSTTPSKDLFYDDDNSNTANANADDDAEDDEQDDSERIHLQDFLKLANIHFMELETTKRRATEGPGAFNKDNANGHSRLSTDEDGRPKDPEIESLVTTVCKVPLLEMYQHACRELKNYIEEGRSIMREIETETYEDNPPIFREYAAATPEMRAQMDNQFKNIKIFARLQSKKQWYEWRTKLHEGLQEGMLKVLRDLEKDKHVLKERREKIDAVYPALLAEYESLERERVQLEAFAAQLGGDDQEALIAARVAKGRLTESIEEHKGETARLETEMKESKARVAAMKTEREQYLKELEEAKRIQEERRSWSHQEISSLKTQVDALEKKSGWAVTGAQGTTLSMAYRREIELVFDVAAFRPGPHKNAQIDLWYIGHTRTRDPQPCTPETEFFLQCIRDHVRGLKQAETHPGKLLKVVRASWDTAKQAANQIRQLNLTFPTTTTKTSDTSIAVAVSILLVPLRTKVEVTLHLRSLGAAAGGGNAGSGKKVRGLRIAVSSEARVVYGEPFNVAKMGEFLAARIGKRVASGAAAAAAAKKNKGKPVPGYFWVDMMEELKAKLLVRGRKLQV
ncbi:hypothetical protein Sste5346_005647 [Sporothrix stenoceras]|uniref:Spc7 kinetochore protein domain-containing protein n=1 Tax=Sporothrix stenoceras TaxID=5173 RepID=A0ABR3Z3M3_9PEZI